MVLFLYVVPLLNYLFLWLMNLQSTIEFRYFVITDYFPKKNIFSLIAGVLKPTLLILIIEGSIFLLRKTPPGARRLSLILVSLITSGYLIFEIFYLAFSVVVDLISTRFEETLLLMGINFPFNILIIIIIVFSFFIYINHATQKTKQYIN